MTKLKSLELKYDQLDQELKALETLASKVTTLPTGTDLLKAT